MILAVREMEPSRRWSLSSSCRVHHGRRGSSFSCPVSKIHDCFFRTKKPRRNCVSCPYRVALVQRKYRRAHYLGRLYRVRPTGDHRHSRSNSLPLSFSLQSEHLEHQFHRTANRKLEKGRGKPICGSSKHQRESWQQEIEFYETLGYRVQFAINFRVGDKVSPVSSRSS